MVDIAEKKQKSQCYLPRQGDVVLRTSESESANLPAVLLLLQRPHCQILYQPGIFFTYKTFLLLVLKLFYFLNVIILSLLFYSFSNSCICMILGWKPVFLWLSPLFTVFPIWFPVSYADLISSVAVLLLEFSFFIVPAGFYLNSKAWYSLYVIGCSVTLWITVFLLPVPDAVQLGCHHSVMWRHSDRHHPLLLDIHVVDWSHP